MSTKFVCDVCDYETDNPTELQGVKQTYKDGITPAMKFDICPKCAEKMFKKVKRVRSWWKVFIKETNLKK